MTEKEFEQVDVGHHLYVNDYEIIVTGKLFQYGEWFVDTQTGGQFNISVCSFSPVKKDQTK